MTPVEVNAVFTHAAKFDARMKRLNPEDQADMAEAWAAVIPDSVSMVDARLAVEQHYATSRDVLMLADLLELTRAQPDQVSPWEDLTDTLLEARMVRDLKALGTTPEEYRSDPATRARVDAALDKRQIEEETPPSMYDDRGDEPMSHYPKADDDA